MRLPLNQAKPGMVLCAAVTDARGRLLLRNGEALTDRILAKLATLGVSHVEVLDAGGAPPPPPSAADAEAIARVEKALDQRFSRLPEGPWREDLRTAVRKARIDHYGALREFVSDMDL